MKRLVLSSLGILFFIAIFFTVTFTNSHAALKKNDKKKPSAFSPSPDHSQRHSPLQITLGNPNAPVVIVEYSSITCGHCGIFAEKKFPKLCKEYVDSGKVFYIIREFPMDMIALTMSQIIFNQDPKLAKKLREKLLINQEKWLLSKDPKKKALEMFRLAGITPEIVKKAENNKKLKEQLLFQRINASKLVVNGTPVFFIYPKGATLEESEQVIGNASYSKFTKAIEKFLKIYDSKK